MSCLLGSHTDRTDGNDLAQYFEGKNEMAPSARQPVLTLPRRIYAALGRHGEERYPEECCGILLGQGHTTENHEVENRVIEAIPVRNACTEAAHRRYQIAPADLIAAQKQARQQNLEIVGFYHSHPDHPAQWSRTDLAEAHWLGASYVITSVEQGVARATNSFRLSGEHEEEKHFVEERLVLEE